MLDFGYEHGGLFRLRHRIVLWIFLPDSSDFHHRRNSHHHILRPYWSGLHDHHRASGTDSQGNPVNLVNSWFGPVAMNNVGVAIGSSDSLNDGGCFASGTNLVSLGTNSMGFTLNDQNMGIGCTTPDGQTSGTAVTGMLWILNSGSVKPYTMQSLVPQTYGNKEVKSIIPYAISNVNPGNNHVSILCSGSAMQVSGTLTPTMQPATLPFPSGCHHTIRHYANEHPLGEHCETSAQRHLSNKRFHRQS